MQLGDDPELEYSRKCQVIETTAGDFEVSIYRLKGAGGWNLEVLDEQGNSTVWDDFFESDQAALAQAKDALKEESLPEFLAMPAQQLNPMLKQP